MTLYDAVCAEAYPAPMSKALRLIADPNSIRNKSIEQVDGATIVNAEVVGSGGWPHCYDVSVTFNNADDSLIDYYCNCPAYINYDGPCKHCLALGLGYAKNPKSYGYTEGSSTYTSTFIASLLEKEQKAEQDFLATRGNIHVIPDLNYNYDFNDWTITFKIQKDDEKAYVIKKIGEFVDCIENREFHEYGKYLAFTHNISAFDKKSQKIVNFLIDLATMRGSRYSYSPSTYLPRELHLTQMELGDLFKALEGTTFSIKVNGTMWLRNEELRIIKDNPPLTLKIAKIDNGYELYIDKKFVPADAGSDMYVWIDGDAVYKCTENFTINKNFFTNFALYDDFEVPFISEEDFPIFCTTILPQLQRILLVKAPKEAEKFKRTLAKFKFYFDKKENDVTLDAVTEYGSHYFSIWGKMPKELANIKTSEPKPTRNFRQEFEVIQAIQEYFIHEDESLSVYANSDDVAALVFEGLPKFVEMGEVYSTPQFDKLLGKENASVQVDVLMKKSALQLHISSSELTNEEIAECLKGYHLKRKYHMLSSGALVNLEELELEELDEVVTDLDISQKDLKAGTIQIPNYIAFYLDSQKGVSQDKSFKSYMKSIKKVEGKQVSIPNTLDEVLRPYQKDGLKWLSSRAEAGFGGILADEMGLGKSIQLISLLLSKQKEADEPSLIICPSSLVYNWKAEFDRFAPQLKVETIAGQASDRKKQLEGAFSKHKVDVLITSYDLARIDAENYEGKMFFLIALDEAQYIKNTLAKTSKAVKNISAKHRFALTGTPIENRLSELWSIFDFLMPGILGNKTHFRKHFESPISDGNKGAQKRLQALVSPFILRRCKRDVLKDLPNKLESVVYSEMKGEQKKLYDSLEKRLAVKLQMSKKKRDGKPVVDAPAEFSQIELLSELTKLRQVCCDPRLLVDEMEEEGAKLGTITELIDSAIDGGEKVLLFSQFTSYLDLIAEKLKKQDIEYYTITGATPKKKRLDLVNSFNVKNVPVFLISLKAGGTGLNLTGASVVIHADPWWNDAAQQQATDRAHRIGQTRVVNVQKVIAKDTIEERIVKLQEKKRELSEQFVKEGSVSLSSLSEQDLFELLNGED